MLLRIISKYQKQKITLACRWKYFYPVLKMGDYAWHDIDYANQPYVEQNCPGKHLHFVVWSPLTRRTQTTQHQKKNLYIAHLRKLGCLSLKLLKSARDLHTKFA